MSFLHTWKRFILFRQCTKYILFDWPSDVGVAWSSSSTNPEPPWAVQCCSASALPSSLTFMRLYEAHCTEMYSLGFSIHPFYCLCNHFGITFLHKSRQFHFMNIPHICKLVCNKYSFVTFSRPRAHILTSLGNVWTSGLVPEFEGQNLQVEYTWKAL